MSVTVYSKSKNGSEKLSQNFTVREFACRDGADKILIDSALVTLLQSIRTHFGKPVNLNSAYRTEAHNRAVGGASGSYHLKGMAADITVSGVAPQDVAAYAETLGARGIGLYPSSGFVHVDTRPAKYYWKSGSGGETSVSTFGGAVLLKYGNRGAAVGELQGLLNKARNAAGLGFALLVPDGIFGAKTRSAVVIFQRASGLAADGIAGPKTFAALRAV